MTETAAEAVAETAAETVVERLAGRRPSRTRALFVAGAAALGMGMLVYKLLRSSEQSEAARPLARLTIGSGGIRLVSELEEQ